MPERSAARSPVSCSTTGTRVLLIDRTRPRSSRERVPGADWLLGDACEVDNLEQADLASYEVVVGATGDDKVNLVISLLAKTEFSVRRVVARINHPANEWLFTEAWGVDVAVSTPRVLAALVEEAVTVGDLVRLFTIREGQANLIEITLPDAAPCAGLAGARPQAAARRGARRHRARAPGDRADAGGAARGRRRAAVHRAARVRAGDPRGGLRDLSQPAWLALGVGRDRSPGAIDRPEAEADRGDRQRIAHRDAGDREPAGVVAVIEGQLDDRRGPGRSARRARWPGRRRAAAPGAGTRRGRRHPAGGLGSRNSQTSPTTGRRTTRVTRNAAA